MMKRKNLAQIAQRSGVSKSTVSRVLNNCAGVNGELREAVIGLLREEYAATAREEAPADVCVILPDNPKFFWSRAWEGAKLFESRLQIRTYVYSSLAHGTVLNDYFDRIEGSNVKAVIFIGQVSADAQSRLERLAKTRLLIQLCEYTPITNSFFVGSDAFLDGKRLGGALLSQIGEGETPTVAVVKNPENENCRLREEGFLHAMAGRCAICSVDAPKDFSLWSSHLARSLADIPQKIDYLFCTDGMTAQSCEAIRKLKASSSIGYFGFEDPPTAKKYWESGDICALVVQDLFRQAEAAFLLCEAYLQKALYPERKMNYIASELLTNSNLPLFKPR